MGRAVVGVAGIEPATSCSQSRRAPAALHPDYCWQARHFIAKGSNAYMMMISGLRDVDKD